MKKIIIFSTVLILILANVTIAGRWEKISKTIEAEGVEKVIIDADLGAGEFNLKSADIDDIAIIDIEYDSRKIDYEIDYDVKRSTGYLAFESESRRKNNIDTDDNLWDIIVSTKYNTEINFDIGACDAEFDFGGIALEYLEIDVGAAEGTIEFSKPNPIRLKEINIDAGASSIEMISMGNANFDELNFSGGVGSFDIDLRGGEYHGESRVNLEVGLGSAKIIVPKGLSVRIETEGNNWLSSIDFHNEDLDEIDDDLYESPDFDDADDRLVISIEVGLGSVDLYWKK